MNKWNRLSKAEMKNVIGGVEPILCNSLYCAFDGPGGAPLMGMCGHSINGRQCRCIVTNEDGDPYQSIQTSFCNA